MRKYLIIIYCAILLSASQVFAVEDIELLKKSLDTTTDQTERGIIYKRIGDYYVSLEDYKTAANSYTSALSLIRDSLAMDTRIQIIKYLSWGGRLQESIKELNLILDQEPENLPARILRARILSWNGDYDESIEEADRILKDNPGNKDALLIKANALRWQGNVREANTIYQQILSEGEDFDARLGLAYGELITKDISASKESDRLLKPTYPYQEKEMLRFREELYQLTAPRFDFGYSYYRDEDSNEINRYTSGFSFWLWNFRNRVQYVHYDAKDDFGRHNNAEDLSLSSYINLTNRIGLGGGVGLYQTDDGSSTNYFTWNIRTDLQILRGQIGVKVSYEGFPGTAEIIKNDIRVTETTVYFLHPITDRLSFYTSYIYRDYTDDNNSNDFLFSPRYRIHVQNPTVDLGYKFRYLDFNRQSRGGYFDPDNFLSHQIFAAVYFKLKHLYGYLEPYFGYQDFSRDGEKDHDIFGGGSGYLGYRFSKHFALEVTGEGGNYALGTAAGWNYYMVGARLLVLL